MAILTPQEARDFYIAAGGPEPTPQMLETWAEANGHTITDEPERGLRTGSVEGADGLDFIRESGEQARENAAAEAGFSREKLDQLRGAGVFGGIRESPRNRPQGTWMLDENPPRSRLESGFKTAGMLAHEEGKRRVQQMLRERGQLPPEEPQPVTTPSISQPTSEGAFGAAPAQLPPGTGTSAAEAAALRDDPWAAVFGGEAMHRAPEEATDAGMDSLQRDVFGRQKQEALVDVTNRVQAGEDVTAIVDELINNGILTTDEAELILAEQRAQDSDLLEAAENVRAGVLDTRVFNTLGNVTPLGERLVAEGLVTPEELQETVDAVSQSTLPEGAGYMENFGIPGTAGRVPTQDGEIHPAYQEDVQEAQRRAEYFEPAVQAVADEIGRDPAEIRAVLASLDDPFTATEQPEGLLPQGLSLMESGVGRSGDFLSNLLFGRDLNLTEGAEQSNLQRAIRSILQNQ